MSFNLSARVLVDQKSKTNVFFCPREQLVLFTRDLFSTQNPRNSQDSTKIVGNLQKHEGMESEKGLMGEAAQWVLIQHPGREDKIISSVTLVLLTHKPAFVETTEKSKSIIWVELC